MARAPLRSFFDCCRDIIAHGSHRLHGFFFARATCFGTTEVTDLTDFVSIACSLRYLPVTYPWRNMLAQIM